MKKEKLKKEQESTKILKDINIKIKISKIGEREKLEKKLNMLRKNR